MRKKNTKRIIFSSLLQRLTTKYHLISIYWMLFLNFHSLDIKMTREFDPWHQKKVEERKKCINKKPSIKHLQAGTLQTEWKYTLHVIDSYKCTLSIISITHYLSIWFAICLLPSKLPCTTSTHMLVTSIYHRCTHHSYPYPHPHTKLTHHTLIALYIAYISYIQVNEKKTNQFKVTRNTYSNSESVYFTCNINNGSDIGYI